jgi:hypothetical protein
MLDSWLRHVGALSTVVMTFGGIGPVGSNVERESQNGLSAGLRNVPMGKKQKL